MLAQKNVSIAAWLLVQVGTVAKALVEGTCWVGKFRKIKKDVTNDMHY